MTFFKIPSIHPLPATESQEKTDDLFREYFPDLHYEMMHDKSRLMRMDEESNSVPDYRFKIRGMDTAFWMECKNRTLEQLNEFIPVFGEGELTRLKDFENSFLFLKVNIQRESYLYFVPTHHIKTNELHFSFLRPYLLTEAQSVRPTLVKNYVSLADFNLPGYLSTEIWS